jgi:hypothetical protein
MRIRLDALARERRIGARAIGVGGALLVLGSSRAAFAFPSSRLVYERGPGAEECADQEGIRKAVAIRLGYDPFFPTSDKTIVARIVRGSDSLQGQVELVDEHGTQLGSRDFSVDLGKCDELVRAMALSISIAIDPKSAETYAQAPPEEAPQEPLPAKSDAAARPSLEVPQRASPPLAAADRAQSQPRSAPSPSVRWSVGAGGMALLGAEPEPALRGAEPEPALRGAAFASVRVKGGSLALEVGADLPATRRIDGGIAVTASTLEVSA